MSLTILIANYGTFAYGMGGKSLYFMNTLWCLIELNLPRNQYCCFTQGSIDTIYEMEHNGKIEAKFKLVW